MRPLTYAIAFLAILVFAVGGFFAISADRLEESVASLQKSRAARVSRPEPAPTNNRPFSTQPVQANPTPDQKFSPPEKWTRTPMSAEERRRIVANALPQSPQARAAQDGIRVRLHLHAFYAQLGLTPDQIARFETAAGENGMVTMVFEFKLGTYPANEEQNVLS
ncbi:MAG: hypothetical protein NTV51_14865 [Verrucomicrobia bacterium]|nr:hypothetical protein [Verrucomicrobiota bacterium]